MKKPFSHKEKIMIKTLNNDNKDLKCVIYARKAATSDDRQPNSISKQMKVAHAIAEENGYNVVKEFKEVASGRKQNNRPLFAEMIKMIEQGKANAIICQDVNRLGRDPKQIGLIQELLEKQKIRLIHASNTMYCVPDNSPDTALLLGQLYSLRKEAWWKPNKEQASTK